MELIKGIPVTLYERTPVGKDPFGVDICTETAVTVENVLVTPVTADDIVGDQQMDGKLAQYELCIPKGDSHGWEDCRVEFFGTVWRTVGPVTGHIEQLLPLSWNRKVRVEQYG